MDRNTAQPRPGRRLARLVACAGIVTWIAGVSIALLAKPAGRAHGSKITSVNESGVLTTVTTARSIDVTNPFFQDLGSNGRSCFSCHRPDQAWTITPAEVRERFASTGGLDPIFRTNDGSNCEAADVSTRGARRRAFGLLLAKGLIRVAIPLPAGAEFDVVNVDDPYDCGAPSNIVSMYRRPLPTANLAFLSAVMWDGRQSASHQAIRDGLIAQALDAITGHAQGLPPPLPQLEEIVDFELSVFTAQHGVQGVGSLHGSGAHGGPRHLTSQPFCIGINDPLKMLPDMPGACEAAADGFDPNVFRLFGRWAGSRSSARAAIARGEAIFNTRQFTIDAVGGLNGDAYDPVQAPIAAGTCTICHDTPNAGNHSVAMALNIGIADAAQRSPDLPLYTLRQRTTGATVQTTDPGRAMITGRWRDIGKFKGPVLRALAARAPYFHNGSAATLEEVVDFYDTRFQIGLSPREKTDLVAFLRAL